MKMRPLILSALFCLLSFYAHIALAGQQGIGTSKQIAFSVVSPTNGTAVSGTFKIVGTAGLEWVNVRAYIGSTPISADTTPVNGTYTLSVDATQLPLGTNVIAVKAFSVPSGNPAGRAYQQSEIDVTVNVQKPVNGVCGPANGALAQSAPTTGLCAAGAASTVSGSGPWTWSCAGTGGGTTASCIANLDPARTNFTISSPVNGVTVPNTFNVTGTAGAAWVNIRAYVGSIAVSADTAPTNGTYSLAIDATQLPVGTTVIAVKAFSVPPGNPAGVAYQQTEADVTVNIQKPSNGVCGPANGVIAQTAPVTGLCTTGTASIVTGGGPWAWTCAGTNGGTTASCQATFGKSTVLQNTPASINAAAGSQVALTYNWTAVPMDVDYTVFVHFTDAKGNIVFQDDHQPPTPTSKWTGAVSYTRTINVPSNIASATYGIQVGLYYGATRAVLTTGPYVVDVGGNTYQTGMLAVGKLDSPAAIAACLINHKTRAVTEFGAVGDGVTDDTSAIQHTLDLATPGAIVYLPPGTYKVSQSLTINGTGVALVGNSATLVATNPGDQTLNVYGSHNAVVNLALQGTGSTRLSTPASTKINNQGSFIQIIGNTITGGASAGIFSFGAHDYLIWGNSVSATLADGIHSTYGSYNGVIKENAVGNNGDDMIAVVSYQADPSIVSNIFVTNNNVSNNYWGRGISVVGGQQVTIQNNTISKVNAAAGIYIAQENSFSSMPVTNVLVQNNNLSNILMPGLQVPNAAEHPAILLWGNALPVQQVLVAGNTINGSGHGGINLSSDSCYDGVDNNVMSNINGNPLSVSVWGCTPTQNQCAGNTSNGSSVTDGNCQGTSPPAVSGSAYTAYGQGSTAIGSWAGCLDY